ncbi:MAG: AMP-binding protein [Acidimicrobiales bacterium]
MRVPLTIGGFLERAGTVYPERLALVDEPSVAGTLGRITYEELHARARGMAVTLDAMGIGPGERVAIVSPNSGRFLTSYFGVSGFGRVLVPVNYRLNAEEIAFIIEHSGSRLLLVDPELADALSGIPVKDRVVLDGVADAELFAPAESSAKSSPEIRHVEIDEDSTCSINYTSGTTARPKGVQLTHRNCWLNAAMFGWHTTVTDRDTHLHTLPMFHCNGWGMPYAITAMGGTHVVQRKIDGDVILERVGQEGVTLMCGAPAVVAAILDAVQKLNTEGKPIPGSGSTRIVVAGAPPPSKTIERVETELGWEFIQIYGLTETSPLLTINRATEEMAQLSPADRAAALSRAGVPAVGVQIDVDDNDEILARSNHVFAGYWEQPEATEDALEGGWFHTGDGGWMDGPYVVVADRKKDVIISGGENVSSIEVEDCLYQHEAVAEVAVIGVPDDRWGETVKALVVLRPEHQATEVELIEHCRSRMAHFKAPRSVEFRTALDRTATGKLQKFKLRQPYWQGRDKQVN